MTHLVDLLLHADRYLLDIVATYGRWIYGILFLIVFAETGLVVTPFLPGDSLLFAAGAIAATGSLDITTAGVLLLVAAIGGDAVNYSVGRAIGARVIEKSKATRAGGWIPVYTSAPTNFARHGGKAVVPRAFTPIVRTFIPFRPAPRKWPIRPSRSTTSPRRGVGDAVPRRHTVRQRAGQGQPLVALGIVSSHRCRWRSTSGSPGRLRADPVLATDRRTGRHDEELRSS
jgi:hypothetical protein